MDWITLVKEFQTAIVGVIGFTGVIASQLINGWLARKRDEDARQAKRIAILHGALSELKYHRKNFAESADEVVEAEFPAVHFPIPKRVVTSGLMNELGWLPEHTLDDTLYALQTIDEVGRRILLMADSTSNEYVVLSAEKFARVQRALRNMLPNLDKAISELEAAK